MKNPFRLTLLVFGALLLLDQVVKAWARHAADFTEGRIISTVWPGVFELKLVFNEGIAFGKLPGASIWLTPVAVVIAGFALWYSWRHPKEPRLTHWTMALLASGAVGNLIDRVYTQATGGTARVTDMFYIRAINFPVFNIADVCITVAGGLLILTALRDAFRPKAPDAPTSADAEAIAAADADSTSPRG